MKYLICSGDSFTDHFHRSQPHPEMDTSWPKWPVLLGEKLNMKVINVGGSGQGNEFIYSSLQDVIEGIEDKSEIGLVIAAWSQCNRRDYQYPYTFTPPNKLNNSNHVNSGSHGRMGWYSDPIDDKGGVIGWVKRSLRIFKSFEYMCEYHNIPYSQFQMIPLFIDHLLQHATKGWETRRYNGNYTEDLESILKMVLEYDNTIDTTKFIGWPGYEAIGGFTLSDELLGRGDLKEQNEYGFIISDLDNHPNAKGQVKIADYLYKKLNV
jgi:hypothetical protein